jgi:hypothetical protein
MDVPMGRLFALPTVAGLARATDEIKARAVKLKSNLKY